jgi:isoleucyl-tRNA synthetase
MEKVQSSLDSEYMKQARFGFGSAIDGLKKDKTIKSTLELTIYTNSDKILALDDTEAQDWFVVSDVSNEKGKTELGNFKVDNDEFIIYKAQAHKCPRCWKFNSEAEDITCARCAEVLA